MPYYKTNAEKAYKAKAKSGKVAKEVCEKRWFGKPCKYCAQVAKLNNGDEDDKNIASKTRSKGTYYMNVIPLIKGGSKISEKVVKVYPSGINNWRDMIALLPDSDGDGVDFTDPDKMRPIILERKGKGRNTTYSLKLAENAIKLPPKFLEKMHKLNKLLDFIDEDDKFFLPEEGKNKFLVLPPWSEEADGEFWFEGFFHWNVDLLMGAGEDGFEDSDNDGFESSDEFSDTGDESFSDKDTSSQDDFEETAGADDDFEEFDETEKKIDITTMDKAGLMDLADKMGVKLSDKAKAAPVEKLREFMAKKVSEADDIPW